MGDLIYDKPGKASRTTYDTRWWAQTGPSLQRLEQRIEELERDLARLGRNYAADERFEVVEGPDGEPVISQLRRNDRQA